MIVSDNGKIFIKKKNPVTMLFSLKEDFSIIDNHNNEDYNITTRTYSYL